jgi:hypothetical protein
MIMNLLKLKLLPPGRLWNSNNAASPLFEDNDGIVDQEQFGSVSPRLPLLAASLECYCLVLLTCFL